MPALETMAATLTNLVGKSLGDAVFSKMKAARLRKNQEEMADSYEAIIHDLMEDRSEAITLAQTYKSEIDRIEISDEDIEHLHNTIEQLINILGKDNAVFKTEADEINALVSVDTLKAVQLLGFNYKEAIGEPLTEACADAIQMMFTKDNHKRPVSRSRRK